MNRPEIPTALFIGPLPPPYSGPEMGMKLFLESGLKEEFEISFLRTNVRRSNVRKGRLDPAMVLAFFNFVTRLVVKLLRDRPDVAYYPITATQVGWIGRDLWCLGLCRLFRVPVVIHLRAGHFKLNFQSFRPWVRRRVERACGRVAAAVVQADYMAEQFSGLVPQECIHCIYQAIESSHYENPDLDRYEPGEVLFVGHLTQAKGYCDLLRAVGPVAERHETFRLLVAGTMRRGERNVLYDQTTGEPLRYEDPFAVEAEFVAGPHAAKYTNLGVVGPDELRGHLASCDLFVLPSYSEGFSRALVEAMCMGKPVIYTPVGAHKEVLKDGIDGLEVPTGDIDALAKAIDRLLADRELRDRIARHNYRRVRADFDISVIAPRLGRVLRRAIEQA